MSDVAIRVKNLGKRYRIGEIEPLNDLREIVSHGVSASFRRLRGNVDSQPAMDSKTIWALKDVSFEVNHGEVVGVIGRNGAGKTTLLKVLSRITSPTEGHAELNGRVGSLLEVGTGFHGDLTGRENVYLNGAILGMRRAEIKSKFDEIVAFAGVEQFIDTPVKRYSTGMGTRLAFAVAAHLDPEILLVDEVLAVGDWEFQKKCLGKMEDVSSQGRTVFFISHNMASIMNLCPRSILLENGRLLMDGPTGDVVNRYIYAGGEAGGEVVWPDPETAPGTGRVRIHAVRVLSDGGVPASDVDIEKDVHIQFQYWNMVDNTKLHAAISLVTAIGTPVLFSSNMPSASLTPNEWWDRPHPPGLFQSVCRIPGNFLNDDTYTVGVILGRDRMYPEFSMESVVRFRVLDSGAMRQDYGHKKWPGVVRPLLEWNTQRVE